MAKKNEKNRKKHDRRRIKHNAHLKEVAALKNFRESTMRNLYAFGIPDFFKLIHEEDRKFYYLTHAGTIRLIQEKGIKVPHSIITGMREFLSKSRPVYRVG